MSSIKTSKPNSELKEIINRGAFLVDVRSAEEFEEGSVPGAVNIPLDFIDEEINKFQGKDDIIVFCRSGNRSGFAKQLLDSKGIQNVENGGSWENVHQLLEK